MKKLVVIFGVLLALLLSGCGNEQIFDTNWRFNKAIIRLGNEIVVVDVAMWRDFEDGEQLQITAEDGTVYLTSSYNCTLIYEGSK